MNETKSGGITFLCAVDGSEPSQCAFDAAKSFVREENRLVLFHAYSARKDSYLPENLKSNKLKQHFDSELQHLSAAQYCIMWENRDEKTVQQTLTESCKSVNPDFIIMGHRGRKSLDLTAPTRWGSNADYIIRHSKYSFIALKKPLPADGLHYLYSVKDSGLCRNGLVKLFKLLTNNDRLTILFVADDRTDQKTSEMEYFYGEYLAANSGAVGEASVHFIRSENAIAMERVIINTINAMNPDFCCLAPRLKYEADTMAERILKGVDANVIMIKP